MTASIWFYLFPLYILGGLLLLLGTFALLGRVKGGRYLKPIVTGLMKLPLAGRLMKKASQAALERQNPELATLIAMQALRSSTSAGGEQALRHALPQVQLVATLKPNSPLRNVDFSRGGQRMVTAAAGGRIEVRDGSDQQYKDQQPGMAKGQKIRQTEVEPNHCQ